MKIGLEIHLQLNTDSKLFCGCTTSENSPNKNTCPICLGHPGSKPMLNKKALIYALKLCVALGCEINKKTYFSRKVYFYPDLSKNFQITQYEMPLAFKGSVKLKSGKLINLQRIHIEEDPASIIYEQGTMDSQSLIDYNRSGIPLVEIVTEPCMSSPGEARDFLKELIKIVKYLGIFDENNGVMKCDLNISVGNHSRVEVKNVSGFKNAERALNYELMRQKIVLKKGKTPGVETHAWDGKKTFLLRKKESEDDYGYITEPDLPVININDELLTDIRKQVPELPHIRSLKYINDYKIDEDDAEVISAELDLAKLFEKVAKEINPKLAAKWLRKELLRVINYNKSSIKELKFDEKELIELLNLLESNVITEKTAKKIMEKLMIKRFSPKQYVEKNNLSLITSEDKIKEACLIVINENKKAVEDYFAGEEKSYHFLLGKAMKLTKGKVEPALTNKIMKQELGKIK